MNESTLNVFETDYGFNRRAIHKWTITTDMRSPPLWQTNIKFKRNCSLSVGT